MWFGIGPGLIRHNTDSGTTDFYNLQQYELLPVEEKWGWVLTVMENADNVIWFGTYGGWALFDPESQTFYSYQNRSNAESGIQKYGVSALWRDKSGIIWMGSHGDGLYRYDPKSRRFSKRRPDDPRLPLWEGASVRSIYETRSGSLWIGTAVSGLMRIDRQTGESFPFTALNEQLSKAAQVYSLLEDSTGALWVNSYDGIYRIAQPDSAQPDIRFFPIDTTVESRDQYNIVYKLYQSRDGKIWVATTSHFGQFDPVTATYDLTQYIEPQSGTSSYSDFATIYEDHAGNFWLGTIDGLRKFDTAKKTFNVYRQDPQNPTGLSHSVVRAIHSDPRQPERYLWLGTGGGGLNRLDLQTDEFLHFTQRDGLPNNVVYAILSDDSQHLWLSTNNGIARLNTETLTVKKFDVNDGLQDNEFNAGAFFKSSSGELFFGGIKGLNAFYPADIRDNDHHPQVVITDFRISNQSVAFSNPGSLQNNQMTYSDTVKLSHDQRVFSFEFAALDFTDPSKNRYQYTMENFDDEWQDAGTNRQATYTNLDHGEYVFRVKGSNNDGLWSKSTTSVYVIIEPPWWRTYWAYAGYALLLIFLLVSFRSYEMNRQRLKYNLQVEKIEREKLRELDQLRSRFFTNVSHEFRTPLTLVLGQISSVLSKIDSQRNKHRLQVAHRNAGVLLHLINQLMDMSRLEAGKMNLNIVYADLIPFLKNLLFSFDSLAEQKQLTLHFQSNADAFDVCYDRDILEKTILNLLSNAFKFTPAGGKITLTVTAPESVAQTPETMQYVEIHVEDTGTGIPKDRQELIFNRFYQLENPFSGEYSGSGIGLAVVKEMVELHYGKIELKSLEGSGSTFSVYLPAGRAFYTAKGIQPSFSKPATYDEPLPDREALIAAILSDAENNAKVTQSGHAGISTATDQPIVLVVEDHNDVRSYICDQLKNDGYTVFESPDGKDGIAKAREIIPDLIITDVMMPKVDGYEFSKQIRADQKTSHIPLIMLTAKASEDSKIEGLEAGVDDYLVKPFSARELQVRVRNLIQLRKQLRARFSHAAIIEPSEVSDLPLDQIFLRKVIDTIKSRMGDETFGVEDLASNTGMSVTHLNRKLRALLDQSPGQFIRSQRLQRAAELLLQNAGNVAEIAYRVGFSDQAHFTRSFKKQFGCPPTKYNG